MPYVFRFKIASAHSVNARARNERVVLMAVRSLSEKQLPRNLCPVVIAKLGIQSESPDATLVGTAHGQTTLDGRHIVLLSERN